MKQKALPWRNLSLKDPAATGAVFEVKTHPFALCAYVFKTKAHPCVPLEVSSGRALRGMELFVHPAPIDGDLARSKNAEAYTLLPNLDYKHFCGRGVPSNDNAFIEFPR